MFAFVCAVYYSSLCSFCILCKGLDRSVLSRFSAALSGGFCIESICALLVLGIFIPASFGYILWHLPFLYITCYTARRINQTLCCILLALGSSPSWVLHVCDSEQLMLYTCILVVYLTLWYSFRSLDCCDYAILLTKLGLCPLLYNSGVAQITYLPGALDVQG